MGVIKKNNAKLGRFSESEESLHIPPSSEDDDAVSSTSELSAPLFPAVERRHRRLVPESTSFLRGRRVVGKKRSQRLENAYLLETLVENEELQAVTIHDFIPDSNAVFSQVLESGEAMEIWESFVNSSEDVQKQITEPRSHFSVRKILSNPGPQTAEEAFRNIKTGLRNALKKTHVPLGILENLENRLVEFFSATPADIFISDKLSSFERLLLHAVAQYYCLKSFSFDSERSEARLVKVYNPQKLFQTPSMLLVQFLEERKKKLLL